MQHCRTDARVADALLTHLRLALAAPGLRYATVPTRILGGNETAIYGFELQEPPEPFAGPLILRVHVRPSKRDGQCLWEEAVHNTLAELGFPVPRVVHAHAHADAGLGGPFVIMERAAGQVMGSEIGSIPRLLLSLPRLQAEIPRTLADMQVRLHALDPEPLRRRLAESSLAGDLLDVGAWVEEMRARIERNALPGLLPAVPWLEEHLPAAPAHPVVCHGDFHPLNILREDGRVTGIVDWSRVVIADPEFDVGNTCVILTLSRINLPAVLQPAVRWLTRGITRSYLREYQRTRPLDPARLRYAQVIRAVQELGGYDGHLADAPTYEGVGHAAEWDYPRLRALVEAQTGVRISHPAAP